MFVSGTGESENGQFVRDEHCSSLLNRNEWLRVHGITRVYRWSIDGLAAFAFLSVKWWHSRMIRQVITLACLPAILLAGR